MSLRDELTRIAAVNDDTLTPELVVEDAQPRSISPQHARRTDGQRHRDDLGVSHRGATG